MTVDIDGLKIEYTECGEGKTEVLLLHGWGCNFGLYEGLMQSLSDRCRTVALNFPGCGNSDIMSEPWDIDDYCGLVMKFISAAGLSNPILIGHSHGGRVIMKLVGSGLLSPPKIVLLDSAGLIPKKSARQKLRARSFKAIKRVLSLPIIKNHSEPLLEKARRHYGSADYNAAPEVLRKTMVSLVNTDLRGLLPAISCPSLLIWGENDGDTPLEDAKTIEKLIPDAGLCVIKGAGHFAFCERPAQVYAILRSFIN